MTPQVSALLDQSLPVHNSILPLHLWTNIASIHLERPVGFAEFRAWLDDHERRYPKMLADVIADLERRG